VHRTSLVKSRALSCSSAMGRMARIGVAARLKRPPVVPRNKIEVSVRYETSTKESHTPRITVVQLVLPQSRMPRRVETNRQQSELGTIGPTMLAVDEAEVGILVVFAFTHCASIDREQFGIF
jgi:hypothetical protein